MPLEDTTVVLHHDPTGVLGDACATLGAHHTDRRRLHAIRRHRYDHPNNKNGGHPSRLAPALPPELLPEPRLGAYEEEVLEAHARRQEHHVDAGSKVYWRRQGYAQRPRGTADTRGVEPLTRELVAGASSQPSSPLAESHLGNLGDLTGINVRAHRHAVGLRTRQQAAMGINPWFTGRVWAADEHPGADVHRQKEDEREYRARALGAGDVDNPLSAELHRRTDQARDSPHKDRTRVVAAAGGSPPAATGGGTALARRVQTANLQDALMLAPSLEALCFEAPKEDALLAGARLGALARGANRPADAAVLQQAALALFASAVARARDAHSAEFLVESLEAMHAAGTVLPEHVDSVLATLFAQLSRAELSPELARRAASALEWVASTSGTAGGVPLHISGGSRRAVAAIRRAIAGGPAAGSDERLLGALDGLMASGIRR